MNSSAERHSCKIKLLIILSHGPQARMCAQLLLVTYPYRLGLKSWQQFPWQSVLVVGQ